MIWFKMKAKKLAYDDLNQKNEGKRLIRMIWIRTKAKNRSL